MEIIREYILCFVGSELGCAQKVPRFVDSIHSFRIMFITFFACKDSHDVPPNALMNPNLGTHLASPVGPMAKDRSQISIKFAFDSLPK